MSTSVIDKRPAPEVSAWMFFRSLKASGLVHPEDIAILERRAQDEPVAAIIDTLLEENLLNDYQLQRLKDADPHGLVLGQYRILGELGEGGCGKVYKARHALMQRTVALKVIGSELVKNKHARDIFLREVIACTRLHHPNIAIAFDANEHDGQLFFVMEYVPGKTLHAHVVEYGPLPFAIACSITIEAAMALQHAHEQGLVHRDIKPANIILVKPEADTNSTTAACLLKVVDFGLARIGMLNSHIMATIPCGEGGLVGTPAYIAPEQIRDAHTADIRSDLYSLGCTLYFALTSRPPFNGMSAEITLHQHLEEPAEPIATFRPDVPPALARIVERLMAKHPSQRYQTPNELIDAINAFALSGGLNASGITSMDLARTPAPASRKLLGLESRVEPGQGVGGSSAVVLMEPPSTVPPPAADPQAAAAPTAALPGGPAADLTALYSEWRELIELLRAGKPHTVTDALYKALYKQLLAAIRAARFGKTEFLARQYDDLAGVVEPWVMLPSLQKLDAASLASLARKADQIADVLWPPAPVSESSGRGAVILAVVLAAAAALVWYVSRGRHAGF